MQEFKLGPADVGERTDVFVASKYPDFTRSSLEMLFDKGLVKINQQVAKASHRLKSGDRIVVDEQYLKTEPPKIKLPVIYEDDDVIVINKPEGVLTHAKGALNLEGTVASFIKDKLNDKALTGNRAGIVHRLDRATSGIIITAKNSSALGYLQKQFSGRRVKKKYLALVEGMPEPAEAIIDAPIMRNPTKPQTFKVGAAGKPAITEYRVLKRADKNSLLELSPKTGRTHQLRVHLAYIHTPVVGDRVYGREGEHLMLHAASLELTLPGGRRQVFSVPAPAYFKEFSDA